MSGFGGLDVGVLNLVVIGGSCFLIGSNIALIAEYFPSRFRAPFVGKMVAVSVLLVYIALSAAFGTPAQWRLWIAVFALSCDGVALCWIWRVVRQRGPNLGLYND